jgi:transcriptional regulator with XRE-family HTH domain
MRISRLRQQRVVRGLTLRDVHRDIGVDPGHLGEVERGLARPSWVLLKLLPDYYGLSPAQLVEEEK